VKLRRDRTIGRELQSNVLLWVKPGMLVQRTLFSVAGRILNVAYAMFSDNALSNPEAVDVAQIWLVKGCGTPSVLVSS
jgi:hypothetical protein